MRDPSTTSLGQLTEAAPSIINASEILEKLEEILSSSVGTSQVLVTTVSDKVIVDFAGTVSLRGGILLFGGPHR